MRRGVVLWAVVLVSAAWATGVAASARGAGGLLTGDTQISFGCPGPAREGMPGCNPWHPLPQARFAITASPAGSAPRIVVSDLSGRFSVSLPAGRYIVTPLPGPALHTNGGKHLVVQVRAGRTNADPRPLRGLPPDALTAAVRRWAKHGELHAPNSGMRHPLQFL
jgi:hypothetical protein